MQWKIHQTKQFRYKIFLEQNKLKNDFILNISDKKKLLKKNSRNIKLEIIQSSL